MAGTVEDFVATCFDELQLSQRFVPYVRKAEDAGQPQLAKLFRALVASETVREALFRKSVVRDAALTCDYFVCPF